MKPLLLLYDVSGISERIVLAYGDNACELYILKQPISPICDLSVKYASLFLLIIF